MSLSKSLILATALLGMAAFSMASAQEAVPRKSDHAQAKKSEASKSSPPSFSQIDKNHDGQIRRSEIPHDMHNLRLHFMQADLNGDGSLSKKEYQAATRSRPVQRL